MFYRKFRALFKFECSQLTTGAKIQPEIAYSLFAREPFNHRENIVYGADWPRTFGDDFASFVSAQLWREQPMGRHCEVLTIGRPSPFTSWCGDALSELGRPVFFGPPGIIPAPPFISPCSMPS